MALDLGYVYGFFDGEGCIVDRCAGPESLWHTLEIHVTQCDRRVLDRMAKDFGGAVLLQRYNDGPREKRENGFRRAVYRWRLTGYAAYAFLRRGMPYLIVKRSEAIKAIETWQRRNRKRDRMPNAYYKEMKKAGRVFRQADLSPKQWDRELERRQVWLQKRGWD